MKQVKMDGYTLYVDEQGKVPWATYPGEGLMFLYAKDRQGYWVIAQDLTVQQIRGRYRRGTLKIW